jgi:hypothetical protein
LVLVLFLIWLLPVLTVYMERKGEESRDGRRGRERERKREIENK